MRIEPFGIAQQTSKRRCDLPLLITLGAYRQRAGSLQSGTTDLDELS